MKYLVLSLFLSASALANWFTGEGEFSKLHPIAFMSYEDQAACEADEGKWDDGLCWFDTSDEVSVERNGEKYLVKVDTVTTNAHTCSFEGEGVMKGTQIVATSEGEEWDGENPVPVTCEVTLDYLDGDTVNVTNNGKCQYFCGARATLEIEGAKRK